MTHNEPAAATRVVIAAAWAGVLGLLPVACPAAAAGTLAVSAPDATRAIIGATEAAHLRRGLEYFAAGDDASAVIEFETVLRRNDLPPTPHQQAEIYADAARAYLAGRRFQAGGYALLGFGSYAENDTAAGRGQADDMFFSARAGVRGNYLLSAANTLNLSLDYRYRAYDDAGRRDDSDLRWNANLSHVEGDANLSFGVRGHASYRGNGQARNDYGVFTQLRILADPEDQFLFGAEVRRRDYPAGRLRDRSRNIVEFSGGWTRTLFGGRASFELVAGGGLEVATDDRPDGDAVFVNVSPTLSFSLDDQWGGYVFLWWQNDAYNIELAKAGSADDLLVMASRTDDLVEIGGGLAWEFARGWSLNPELLWIRDFSNVLAVNYSSTELHLTLRKDF